MKLLENKTNVSPPTPSFPYGALNDDPGNGTGTPVDVDLLSDIIQTMSKIFAESGMVANNNLDNEINGWQLYEAMKSVFNPYKEYTASFGLSSGVFTSTNVFVNSLGPTPVVAYNALSGTISISVPSFIGKPISDIDISVEISNRVGASSLLTLGPINYDDSTGVFDFFVLTGSGSSADFNFRVSIRTL